MKDVEEGAATIRVPTPDVVHRKQEVFYNPLMRLNRDVTLLLLRARDEKDLRVADPLAGSGVRSIRMRKELPKGMLGSITVNDLKEGFKERFRDDCERSGCSAEDFEVHEEEASLLLLRSKAFDYVDIDPFGSPNQFLDAAIRRTKRGGVLAVTATDTAPLCGTYPAACARKYWARPRRDHLMHEWGVRILIRKCQLIGAQYDKALRPILSYSRHHYLRVFFEAAQGKSKVDAILEQHEEREGYGPLWTGELWDDGLVRGMLALAEGKDAEKLLEEIAGEMEIKAVGFYDVHELSRELRLKRPPASDDVIERLRAKDVKASRTHFSPTGIRAACEKETMTQAMREASR